MYIFKNYLPLFYFVNDDGHPPDWFLWALLHDNLVFISVWKILTQLCDNSVFTAEMDFWGKCQKFFQILVMSQWSIKACNWRILLQRILLKKSPLLLSPMILTACLENCIKTPQVFLSKWSQGFIITQYLYHTVQALLSLFYWQWRNEGKEEEGGSKEEGNSGRSHIFSVTKLINTDGPKSMSSNC